MLEVSNKQFWLVVGSQHLYGPEALEEVRKDARTVEVYN